MKGLIRLFDSNETNFKHNKNVLSEFTSAYITEDIDGTLEFDGEYPLFDKKSLSKELNIGKIIKSPIYDSRPDQLFKIRKPNTSTSNKTVSVYAQAIGYADLGSNIVLGCHIPPNTTRKNAIGMLLNARQQKIRDYHVGNLDTSTNTNINLGLEEETGNVINYLDIDYKAPLKGLLDDSENSIYKAYKGEIIWNNFEINMVDKRGNDNKFTIRSGKNLQDFEKEISDMNDDFATALIMCSSDGLYLPNNEIIYSSLADKYDRYHYKVIKCDDVSLEDLITENSSEEDIEKAKNIVYEQLRERAENYFKEGTAELLGSYTINFIELAKSEEYKDYAQLTHCAIGNEVTTIYPELDLKVTTRVTKIKYNILKDEIEEITVGNIKKDIADSVTNTENKVESVKEDATDTKYKFKKNKKKVDAEIQNLGDEILLRVQYKEFAAQIDMHYDSILLAVNDDRNGTDVIIDTSGLSVHNGKFKIYNESDELCFWVSKNGQLFTSRSLDIQDNSGEDLMSLNGNRLYWYTSRGIRGIEATSKGIDVKGNLYINGESLESIIQEVINNK
ncbi:phage tail spike protein [Clostridium butyricum]